jgi:hypothetical protein
MRVELRVRIAMAERRRTKMTQQQGKEHRWGLMLRYELPEQGRYPNINKGPVPTTKKTNFILKAVSAKGKCYLRK